MAVSKDFINAVQSGNMRLTRIMLKDSMLVDLTLRQFEEERSYAEAQLPNLYDAHDGEEFNLDLAAWTKDLLDEQMVRVVTNFSRERVAFLKKLVRHLYPRQAEQAERAAFVREHKKDSIDPVHVGTGLAVCGAAAAVAGIAISQPPVIVTGVAAAAVGGAIILKNR